MANTTELHEPKAFDLSKLLSENLKENPGNARLQWLKRHGLDNQRVKSLKLISNGSPSTTARGSVLIKLELKIQSTPSGNPGYPSV